MTICIGEFLFGVAFGFCFSLYVFNYLLQSVARNKEQLRKMIGKLIADVYHRDIFPEICRAEGLINLATREHHHQYAALALIEIQKLKERFLKIIKKYEPYQDEQH